MKLTAELALTRARRGIQFLNHRRPGWRKHVNPARLDMSRGSMVGRGDCGCILAQIQDRFGSSGSFALGAETVGVNPGGPRAVALGFRASEGTQAEYALLTAAWLHALAEAA